MTPAQAAALQGHLDARPHLPADARHELAEALGIAPYWGADLTAHGNRPALRTPDITEPTAPTEPRRVARHHLQVAYSGRRIA